MWEGNKIDRRLFILNYFGLYLNQTLKEQENVTATNNNNLNLNLQQDARPVHAAAVEAEPTRSRRTAVTICRSRAPRERSAPLRSTVGVA